MPSDPPAAIAQRRKVELARLHEEVAACRACPRLVAWREDVARAKRASFADQEYWGRAVPGFGDPSAWLLIVGLAPAADSDAEPAREVTGRSVPAATE